MANNITLSLPRELIEALVLTLSAAITGDTATIPATSTAPAVDPKAPVVNAKDHTVYFPVTKHTLKMPTDEQLSFWGYMIDNAKAANGAAGQNGPFAANAAFNEAAARANMTPGDFSTARAQWPLALDMYYNKVAYGLESAHNEPIVLQDAYGSASDLENALKAGYPYAVLLDGKEIHMGFGPADKFYTWSGGSVHKNQEHPATPAPTPVHGDSGRPGATPQPTPPGGGTEVEVPIG